MNSAQIHLAVNHFPIAGIMLAFVFTIWGILSKKDELKLAAVSLALIASVSGAIMMATGEGAEEMVEHKQGVTKNLIHEHEEAAEASVVLIHISSVLGIAWVIMNRMNKNHKDKVFMAMALTTLVASGLVARAAHEGGKIRHDEIRSTVASAMASPEAQNQANVVNESHESNEQEKAEQEGK